MRHDRLILAFDTSAAHCAAAVFSSGRLLAARQEGMERGQAERLFPLLAELLAEAGAGWPELTAIAVGIGPGNFTGVRLSVAAARGLALAGGIPAFGVSGLEALAFGAPRPVLATLDARRGQVYAQLFEDGGARAPVLAARDGGLPRPAAGALTCVGDHAGPIAADLRGRAAAAAFPLAEAMARIAAARPLPAARPAPLYLREADALPPRSPPPVLLTS